MCTPMFIAALLKKAKRWKQLKCLSAKSRIKKMWYMHTMGCYSVIKKETLPYALTWKKLEDTMLSKINQSQKAKYDSTYMRHPK